MTDGVNNNTSTSTAQYSTLKLKGKNGKTINLDNLEGLQRTKGNEVLFKQYDKDGDGIINKDEAISMRSSLQELAGNGKISKRELNSLFGKDANAMEALNKLADQQNTAKGTKYTEVNGNTTTEFYNSAFGKEYSDRKDITENSDGSTTTVYQDGTTQITQKDGSFVYQKADGTTQELGNADGSRRSVAEDGTVTVTDANGGKTIYKQDGTKIAVGENSSVTTNADGQTVETLTTEEGAGYDVRTKYEYKDGQTIAREYQESWEDGTSTPGAVTVTQNEDGHSVQRKYDSEDDMTNNHPSEMTTDGQNPTLKTTTKFTYDTQGNVKEETTNPANEVTTTFKDADGNEIDGSSFDGQQTYTVSKNETISKILDNTLKQQGIDPDSLSDEQKKEYKKQLLEANKDNVQTYNGSKTEYKGNKFFYPNTELNIPKYGAETEQAEETQEAKETQETEKTEETKEAEETQEAEDVEETEDAEETSDDQDVEEMMKTADTDKSNTIEEEEYEIYVNNLLKEQSEQNGVPNTISPEEKELIKESFKSLDTIKSDGHVTKEELKKNARTVLTQLGSDMDDIEKQQQQGLTTNSERDGGEINVPKDPDKPDMA